MGQQETGIIDNIFFAFSPQCGINEGVLILTLGCYQISHKGHLSLIHLTLSFVRELFCLTTGLKMKCSVIFR